MKNLYVKIIINKEVLYKRKTSIKFYIHMRLIYLRQKYFHIINMKLI